MNAFIFRIAILPIAVLVSSCVTPSSVMVDSVTVKRYETFPYKVFVLSYLDTGLPNAFKDGYVEGFAKEFSKQGSAAVVAQVTGLELDKDIYARQIEDFQPDLILVVRSSLDKIWNNIYIGKIYLTLVDPRNNTEVWKSLQTFSFEPYTRRSTTKTGAGFAGKAFQKLLQDGVFVPKRPNKNNDKSDRLPNSEITAMQ